MNGLEMQREDMIEVVGTQYEDRAKNHANLRLRQGLVMQHQANNAHDANAVLILTEAGKELGYLPKGYASVYAPAIDSDKYHFTVEVAEATPDPERPILIVRILAERKNLNESDVEKHIFSFAQMVSSGFTLQKERYLQFIESDEVDPEALFSCLNQVRLLKKLCTATAKLGPSQILAPSLSERGNTKNTLLRKIKDVLLYRLFSSRLDDVKDALLREIKDIRSDIQETLKKIQKAYNDTFDIDDEEQYQNVQIEMREKRRKFQMFRTVANDCCEILENYISLVLPASSVAAHESVVESTASQMDSPEAAPVDTQEVCEPSSEAAASTTDSSEVLPSTDTQNDTIALLDFSDRFEHTYSKPVSYTLWGKTQMVDSWIDAYTNILFVLYQNDRYRNVLRSMIGKPLLGQCIDFADSRLAERLRKPRRVADDFYIEENLSAGQIVKCISKVLAICGIDCANLQIRYNQQSEQTRVEQDIASKWKTPESVGSVRFPNTNTTHAAPQEKQENPIEPQPELMETERSAIVSDHNGAQDVSPQITASFQTNGWESEKVFLTIAGKQVQAYDVSDALRKVCEFLIHRKPFFMARITTQRIEVNHKKLFLRHAKPIEGYQSLSNGLKVMTIDDFSTLQTIVTTMLNCCRLSNDLITLQNE